VPGKQKHDRTVQKEELGAEEEEVRLGEGKKKGRLGLIHHGVPATVRKLCGRKFKGEGISRGERKRFRKKTW